MKETAQVPRIRASKRSRQRKTKQSPPAETAPEIAGDGEPSPDATRISVEGYSYALDFEAIAKGTSAPDTLLFWVDLLSRAEREQIMLEARYRQFRANAICTLLEKDPKIAEWKARALLENTDAFRENKSVMAEAQRNVILLRGVLDALCLGYRAETEIKG